MARGSGEAPSSPAQQRSEHHVSIECNFTDLCGSQLDANSKYRETAYLTVRSYLGGGRRVGSSVLCVDGDDPEAVDAVEAQVRHMGHRPLQVQKQSSAC